MAATRFFGREEVLRQLFEDKTVREESEEEEGSDLDEKVDSLNREREQVEELLSGFEGGCGFNREYFQANAVQVLLPIVRRSYLTEQDGDEGTYTLIIYRFFFSMQLHSKLSF